MKLARNILSWYSRCIPKLALALSGLLIPSFLAIAFQPVGGTGHLRAVRHCEGLAKSISMLPGYEKWTWGAGQSACAAPTARTSIALHLYDPEKHVCIVDDHVEVIYKFTHDGLDWGKKPRLRISAPGI